MAEFLAGIVDRLDLNGNRFKQGIGGARSSRLAEVASEDGMALLVAGVTIGLGISGLNSNSLMDRFIREKFSVGHKVRRVIGGVTLLGGLYVATSAAQELYHVEGELKRRSMALRSRLFMRSR